ncbi:hypothetical protein ACE3MZ_12810 [Paenibacillus sp. WLX1005]|uniref:hypothetical protein n=1 Tax=Paenibacillus sp. WLX1005 TaxID=3243766 RepID=UPI0039842D99
MKRIGIILTILLCVGIIIVQFVHSKNEVKQEQVDKQFSYVLSQLADEVKSGSNIDILDRIVKLNTLKNYTTFKNEGTLTDYPAVLLTEQRNALKFNKTINNKDQITETIKILASDPQNKEAGEQLIFEFRQNMQ